MADNNPSDTDWQQKLSLARDGDRAALGDLLSEFWQPMWNLASQALNIQVQREQAASDLVQKTFLDAHTAISKFRGENKAEFVGWLRTILRNNLSDARRMHLARLQRESKAGLLHSSSQQPQPNHPPLDRMIVLEQRAQLEQVIAQLPEHYQTVIRLRYWDRQTYEEIGRATGRSPDSVRQIWYRAIEKMTTMLNQHAKSGNQPNT